MGPLLSSATSWNMLRAIVLVGSGEVIARAMSLLAFMYLARVLEAPTFGILGIASSCIAILVPITELGYGIPATRSMAEDPTRFRELWNAALFPKLAAVFLAFAVVAIMASWVDDTRLKTLLLGNALFIPIGAFSLVWAAYALDAHGWIAGERILQAGAYVVGVLLVIRTDADVIYQPLVLVASAAAGQMLLGLLVYRRLQRAHAGGSAGNVPTVSGGFRLILGRMPITFFIHVAVAASGLLLPLKDVAVVVIAARVFLLGMSFTHVPGSVAFSGIVREMSERGPGGLAATHVAMISGLSITGCVAVALLIPAELIRVLAGEGYAHGSTAVALACIALALQIAHLTMFRVAAASGNEERIGRSMLIWSLPAYLILPVTAHLWGVTGVGVSICAAEMIAAAALVRYPGIALFLKECSVWTVPGGVVLAAILALQDTLNLSASASFGAWTVLFLVAAAVMNRFRSATA